MERFEKNKVGIIGAGNIACKYDNPADKHILTHAHAVVESENFELAGFYDSDNEKAKKAAIKWKTYCFTDIAKMLSQIDVAVISVPDKYHYLVIKECIRFDNLKAIIVEKPFVSSLQQGNEITEMLQQYKSLVFINYSRRYMEEFRILKEVISKQMHEFRCGNCYYGKGTLHNGSHLIDIMRYLFGEFRLDYVGRVEFDFFEEDPSIEFALSLNGSDSSIFFHPVPCREVTIFEFDLLFSNMRIKYSDEKQEIEYSKVGKENLLFDEYNYRVDKTVHLDISNAMTRLYENVKNTMIGSDSAICAENDGIAVVEIVEEIRKKAGL